MIEAKKVRPGQAAQATEAPINSSLIFKRVQFWLFVAVVAIVISIFSRIDSTLYISRIELFSTENGCGYYDVYFTDRLKWVGATTTKHERIANHAIKECITLAKSENVNRLWVMGFESDGDLAFSWDGGSVIKYYENTFSYEMFLTESQESAFKLP